MKKLDRSFKIKEKNLTDVHFSIYKFLVYELYYPELARKVALNYIRNYVPVRMFETEFQFFYQDFLRSWKKKIMTHYIMDYFFYSAS